MNLFSRAFGGEILDELLNLIMEIFRNEQKKFPFELYTSFDNVPIREKSSQLFVVVSPVNFRLNHSFPSKNGRITSFTADFQIDLLSPMTTPETEMLKFFYTVVVPAMHSVNCSVSEIKVDAWKINRTIQKATYRASFQCKGLYIPVQEA